MLKTVDFLRGIGAKILMISKEALVTNIEDFLRGIGGKIFKICIKRGIWLNIVDFWIDIGF